MNDAVLPTLSELLSAPRIAVLDPQLATPGATLQARVGGAWRLTPGAVVRQSGSGGQIAVVRAGDLPHEPADLAGCLAQLRSTEPSALFVLTADADAELAEQVMHRGTRLGLPVVRLRHGSGPDGLVRDLDGHVSASVSANRDAIELAHDSLMQAALAGAAIPELLAVLSAALARPVVLEDAAHRVIGLDGDARLVAQALAAPRFADVAPEPVPGPRLIRASIAARGRTQGWLGLVTAAAVTGLERAVLDDAAAVLALAGLLDRQNGSDNAPRLGVIVGLLQSARRGEGDFLARAAIAGVDLSARAYLAGVIDVSPDAPGRSLGRVERLVMRAARSSGLRLFAETLTGTRLVVVAGGDDASVVRLRAQVVDCVRAQLAGRPCQVSISAAAAEVDQLRCALREALTIADLVQRAGLPARPYYTGRDLGLLPLLGMLEEQDQLAGFVQQALGPLLDERNPQGADLLNTLVAYLANPRSKSAAAQQANVCRSSFYQHLELIERSLGVDLDSGETCTWLHAAVMAWQLRPEVNRSGAHRAARTPLRPSPDQLRCPEPTTGRTHDHGKT